MEDDSNLYKGIKDKVEHLKASLNEKDYKKYKLRLLLCVAERVDQFSLECGQCQLLRQDITTLVQEVSNLIQTADREKQKTYFKPLNRIIGHLQRQHKLATEGYYMAIGVAIGSGLGVALGVAVGNIGTGIPIGVGIGIAIGAALDVKARKEGKVLCPSEKTSVSRRGLVLVGVLGLQVLAGILAFVFINRST